MDPLISIEKTKLINFLIKALEDIKKEELRNQRPGGGYSWSATLSYIALEQAKQDLKTISKLEHRCTGVKGDLK